MFVEHLISLGFQLNFADNIYYYSQHFVSRSLFCRYFLFLHIFSSPPHSRVAEEPSWKEQINRRRNRT